ncbi:MAG: hypothetical protein V4521_04805 [Pseudomonadota bacterium]|jgi:hypothetical protein
MKRLLPLFETGQLYGSDLTGKHHCRGISLTVQWLGLIIDLNIGRVSSRQKGKAR